MPSINPKDNNLEFKGEPNNYSPFLISNILNETEYDEGRNNKGKKSLDALITNLINENDRDNKNKPRTENRRDVENIQGFENRREIENRRSFENERNVENRRANDAYNRIENIRKTETNANKNESDMSDLIGVFLNDKENNTSEKENETLEDLIATLLNENKTNKVEIKKNQLDDLLANLLNEPSKRIENKTNINEVNDKENNRNNTNETNLITNLIANLFNKPDKKINKTKTTKPNLNNFIITNLLDETDDIEEINNSNPNNSNPNNSNPNNSNPNNSNSNNSNSNNSNPNNSNPIRALLSNFNDVNLKDIKNPQSTTTRSELDKKINIYNDIYKDQRLYFENKINELNIQREHTTNEIHDIKDEIAKNKDNISLEKLRMLVNNQQNLETVFDEIIKLISQTQYQQKMYNKYLKYKMKYATLKK